MATKTLDIATLATLDDETLETKLAWYTVRRLDLHPTAIAIGDEIARRAEEEVEADEEVDLRRSVVRGSYKQAYRAKGGSKAAKRSSWDWLAQALASETLDDKAKAIPGAFDRLLDANGLANKWTHLNNGQQRMCGGLALRKVVARTGILVALDGEELVAPADFVAKYAGNAAF